MLKLAERLPATGRRVELQTDPDLNEAIRQRTNAAVLRLDRASVEDIDARLGQLDQEWDIERLLQANASTLILAGVAFGATVDRRFLLLPAAVLSFFAQHALQGWCPPIPIFRRLGVRTVHEIERERYALKALRGDFERVPEPHEAAPNERVRSVLAAVDA
jgi:hypothetical protein